MEKIANYKFINECRICSSRLVKLKKVLDLGNQPLANNYNESTKYSLQLMYCLICQHAQLSIAIAPNELYTGKYPFLAGQSKSWIEHCKFLVKDNPIDPYELVIDIGANDGSLLNQYDNYHIKKVGIEPSSITGNYIKYNTFWNPKIARLVVKEHGHADVIFATNVFAHVDNLNEFLDGIAIALNCRGLFVFEVPDLTTCVKKNMYDTIYHEHLNYFSRGSILRLFMNRKDLFVCNMQSTHIHGGSLLVTISKRFSRLPSEQLNQILKDCNYLFTQMPNFAQTIKQENERLFQTIKDIEGTIYGYGASAKACVRLNYNFTIAERLKGVFDDAPSKINYKIPGTNLSILNATQIKKISPDYIMILSPNITQELKIKAREYGFKGQFLEVVD